MLLYVLRHGPAQDHPTAGGGDDARALTPEGITQTTAAARGLAKLIDPPDLILTSPKLRAVQTAAILGHVLDRTPQTAPVLADGSPADILHQLAKLDTPRVMIVGHEPTLSALVELLCCGESASEGGGGGGGRGFIQMKKASCAGLNVSFPAGNEPQATLLWLASPHLLRLAGGSTG
jgi:phosphohistidine phosphatase